jgi:flagellar motor switch protein FliN/FliY
MKSAAQPAKDDGVYMEESDTGEAFRDAASRNPAILKLPVSIAVSVGRARLTVEQLLALAEDSVLALDAAIDDPVELLIDGRAIARGALVETGNGGVGVRVTETLSDKGA